MKYKTLTDDEVQALKAAKKILEKIAKRYAKIYKAGCKMQTAADAENHHMMFIELKHLGIDVEVDSSVEYEDAVSLHLSSKTYLVSNEEF